MSQLNLQQQEAASHVEGPLLVLAGAGSGKTSVVTHRIARLIDLGVLPTDILAVTFTNKAADELRARIRAKKNAHVLACTFHSLGARILRESIQALGYRPDFAIYDAEDSEKLLKGCLDQLGLGSDRGLLKEMQAAISVAKNKLLGPETTGDTEIERVYELYQLSLKRCNALDFDDLLYLTVKLLQENEHVRIQYQERWLFVLIDEYQDTNFAQYTLVRLLVAKHGNLFAVGDPDQSIYSWRGAQYKNILHFEQDFPGAKIIRLEQNYRSTNNILQASNALIEHNTSRYEKRLWSAHGDGEKIGLFIAPSERMEAEFVADQIGRSSAPRDDIAVFYRTNAQSRTFEDALLARRIPYTIVGGLSFYARREIKDVLAYARLVVSDADLISFLRTINLPKRGFGAATLEKIIAGAERAKMAILPFCREISSHMKLSAKQATNLHEYLRVLSVLRERQSSIHDLLADIISMTGYLQHLEEDPETMEERKENLDELLAKAAEWETEHEAPSLQKFLEELSLRSNTDERPDLPCVKLMTLHNSKGLEFSLVFLVGMEEDLCPHINSKNDFEKLEEERRLCYVGITRAKEKLFLTAARYRFMWGSLRPMIPSRFLKEIPGRFIYDLSPSGGFGSEEFGPGDAVYHQEFGAGIVQRAFQSALGLTYEIRFPDSGVTRSIVAKFAKLKSYDGFIE